MEGRLASSVHIGGLRLANVLPLLPSLLASVAWIWDVEVRLYIYFFTSNNSTAQTRTSGSPCKFGYGLHRFLVLFQTGTGPYGQLAWPGTSRLPFFHHLHVNVYVSSGPRTGWQENLCMSDSSPRPTVAAWTYIYACNQTWSGSFSAKTPSRCPSSPGNFLSTLI